MPYGAAQEYLILLMMKRNIAGAVSSSTKVSGECFHVVRLRSSWQFYRSKHQTFTHEQRQLGSDCARACDMINGKKNAYDVRMRRFNFDFACAGLSLSPLLS